MTELTWRQKWEALEALGNVSLERNVHGEFYLSIEGVELKEHAGDGVLTGSTGEHSPHLEQAILNTWDRCVTNLPADGYLVVEKWIDGHVRKHYKWQGFMWQELEVKEPVR